MSALPLVLVSLLAAMPVVAAPEALEIGPANKDQLPLGRLGHAQFAVRGDETDQRGSETSASVVGRREDRELPSASVCKASLVKLAI